MKATPDAVLAPWHCLGRVEDLPAPGAWLRAPLTRAGVLVTRAADGELRAFHAVCTHRGSALFDAGAPEEGTAARFTCPYHSFEFELDGRACAQVSDLAPVRIDTAHGFVFVTLDDAAPALATALGEMPPWLIRAELAPREGTRRLKRAHRLAYDVLGEREPSPPPFAGPRGVVIDRNSFSCGRLLS